MHWPAELSQSFKHICGSNVQWYGKATNSVLTLQIRHDFQTALDPIGGPEVAMTATVLKHLGASASCTLLQMQRCECE